MLFTGVCVRKFNPEVDRRKIAESQQRPKKTTMITGEITPSPHCWSISVKKPAKEADYTACSSTLVLLWLTVMFFPRALGKMPSFFKRSPFNVIANIPCACLTYG